jgi:sulfatase maturation enzyme AslB (radical SAM superfamily)
MDVQSLSIVVPGGCPNACKFCVSRMHAEAYPNQIEKNRRFRDLYARDFLARMAFARDNGCNNLILTGDGEPLVHERFLDDFASWNARLAKPFRWIELQTSGVTLDDEKLRWLRNTVGVSTIALSLSSIFDSDANAEQNGTPPGLRVDIDALCAAIKRYDFNLRLSLNMTDRSNGSGGDGIFKRAAGLGADQLTFRRLYESGGELPEDRWVREHGVEPSFWNSIDAFIRTEGRVLERLPYGALRYSVRGISTLVDGDCMATAGEASAIRYLILRPDCKLYTKWDDRGSKLF